ncbi:MAG: hypothetical protein GX345_00490 [Clostridiales bacterium]|nr:hypothetical protein [Clostridiales bacterium]
MPKTKDKASGPAAALILRNPVLIELAGICPVAAAAVSLKSAAVLALVSFLILLFTQSFASLFLRKLVRWVRVAIYVLLGLTVVVPAYLLLEKHMPDLRISIGIYLPLLAVNSLTALRCEKVGVRQSFFEGFKDSLAVGSAYALVLLLVGFLRDLFGSGQLPGYTIPYTFASPALLMPFGGFLVLGFLAALLKVLTMKLYPGHAKHMKLDIIPTPVTMKLPKDSEGDSPDLDSDQEKSSHHDPELEKTILKEEDEPPMDERERLAKLLFDDWDNCEGRIMTFGDDFMQSDEDKKED